VKKLAIGCGVVLLVTCVAARGRHLRRIEKVKKLLEENLALASFGLRRRRKLPAVDCRPCSRPSTEGLVFEFTLRSFQED
jgi:hypothetical protein